MALTSSQNKSLAFDLVSYLTFIAVQKSDFSCLMISLLPSSLYFISITQGKICQWRRVIPLEQSQKEVNWDLILSEGYTMAAVPRKVFSKYAKYYGSCNDVAHVCKRDVNGNNS